jgi:hypothetical protein
MLGRLMWNPKSGRAQRPSTLQVATTTVALALCLSISSTAAAQETIDDASRTAARAMGNSGVEAYQAGNYREASDRLEKAYAIARVPSLGLWSARALRKLGLLVEAANRYLETASLQVPEGDYVIQKQAQTDATRELKELKARIPVVKIEVKGAKAAEVAVSVDGTPLAATLVSEPRLVNPGEHKVEGTHGAERAQAIVMVGEGQSATAVLEFSRVKPAGTKAASDANGGGGPFRTLGFVALGVGGAGIITGSVAGILAIDKKSTIDDSPSCEDNRCNDQSLVDSYGTLRTVSSIGLIAGAVVAGVGVTLLFTSSSAKEPSAAAFVGPGSLGVRGRF